MEPAGSPFFRYRVIDMNRQLVMEAGVPVASPVGGSREVQPGTLPAGRYATTTHLRHPSELVEVTRGLLEWAEEQGLAWDVEPTVAGEVWGCRLEHHKTDPDDEPDPHRWADPARVPAGRPLRAGSIRHGAPMRQFSGPVVLNRLLDRIRAGTPHP